MTLCSNQLMCWGPHISVWVCGNPIVGLKGQQICQMVHCHHCVTSVHVCVCVLRNCTWVRRCGLLAEHSSHWSGIETCASVTLTLLPDDKPLKYGSIEAFEHFCVTQRHYFGLVNGFKVFSQIHDLWSRTYCCFLLSCSGKQQRFSSTFLSCK